MSLAKFMAFLWVWFFVVTGSITTFSGAPEPLVGCAMAFLLLGIPMFFALRGLD